MKTPPPKIRIRVVSLRIPDDIYEEICLEAGLEAMSPSKLLTIIVTKTIRLYQQQRIGKPPLPL